MKRLLLTAFAGAIIFASCSNSKDKDKEGDKKETSKEKSTGSNEAWVPVDSATSMQHMMEYGTPGDMHKMMAGWDGTWEGDMTMWQYEGAPGQKMKGTNVASMILGGRYQSSVHTGDMMGMPFEGREIMAYDNATKQFTASWIDNWSTGIMIMSGPWDAASKTITMEGSMPDLDRPGKQCHMRQVLKIIDDNTHHMEMYGPDPKTGKEFKMMEIHATRKK